MSERGRNDPARWRGPLATTQTLAAAYLALARSRELEPALETLLEHLSRLVPSDSSSVLLLDDAFTLSVAAVRGHERWSDPQAVRRLSFDTRRDGVAGQVLRRRHPIMIPDTRSDPRWEDAPGTQHIRCWLGVPIVVGDRAVGLYSLDRVEPGRFDEEEVHLAASLAPAAASAIEIARLLQAGRAEADFAQHIVSSAQDGIAVVGRDLRFRSWNPAMEQLIGVPASEVIGRTRLELFPNLEQTVVLELERRALAGESPPAVDVTTTTPAGREVCASVRFSPLTSAAGDVTGAIVVSRDVTERRRASALSEAQSRILEGIAANAPLKESLMALATLVESVCPGVLCCILLLDEDGRHMRYAAAPSLPDAFVAAVDGREIGPAVGSCGTAMFRGEPVVVTDILEDPLWADYRHLAALGGVRAGWSTPILSDAEGVLGSFALYYREPRAPDPAHREAVELATSVAGVAIRRWRDGEQLRRGAQRLKAVVDGALDAVIGMDASGRVIAWNPRAEAIFGWSAGEAVGRALTELIIPAAQQAAHRDGLARFLKTRRPIFSGRRIELTARRRDGSELPVELSVVATEDAEGVTFTGFAADISERKQAARLVEESEARLSHITDNIREVFWVTDRPDRELVYVSPAYETIWGRSRASLYAHPLSFLDAIHPEDRPRVEERLSRQAAGEYDELYRIVRPDGSTRWIHDRAFPVRGSQGDVTRVVGSAQDVTDLKQAEEALRESEARYRILFESAPDGIFVANPDGSYVDANPSALRMLGYTREELIGLKVTDVVGVSEEARVEPTLAEIGLGVAHKREWLLKRKDGSEFEAEAIGVVMTDGRILGLARDIGERKRIEEQLRQAQKLEAVGRLAGGIAHDFNNILAIVTGYGEIVRSDTPEDHPRHRKLSQILRAAERAARLTRQLLAFSRKQVLEPRVLEPSASIADLRKLLAPLIGEHIDLSVSAEAQGRVRVDPGQFEQVVMNLVVNARDAMPRGGSLRIETADVELDQADLEQRDMVVEPGRYVMIAVGDSGVGMDAATQARIFEPFFSTKGEGQGTGWGLATVYGIVKQSSGDLWVRSEVGAGTEVRVYLPRVDEELDREPEPPPDRERAVSETVLLVEDEPAARELLAEVLSGQGYHVLLAADGEQAVETARSARAKIHLLLSDVVLPRINGREAADRIRVIHPRIKVIFMSGYPDEELSKHGALEPGIVLLRKPFRPADLTRRIAEVLDGP